MNDEQQTVEEEKVIFKNSLSMYNLQIYKYINTLTLLSWGVVGWIDSGFPPETRVCILFVTKN